VRIWRASVPLPGPSSIKLTFLGLPRSSYICSTHALSTCSSKECCQSPLVTQQLRSAVEVEFELTFWELTQSS
jgi:hypothetical protein